MFNFGAKTVMAASADGSKQSKVAVTGAGGRTGSLVFKKLLANPKYQPIGVVRSEASKESLKKNLGASDEQIVVGDILGSNGVAILDKALAGADALVIATSAVPKIKPLSLIPVIFAKITGKEGVRPKFTFKASFDVCML
jgi:glutamyl-tRNA reductase